VRRELLLRIGAATALVHDGHSYLKGRSTVHDAPEGNLTDHRKWLKKEAEKYMNLLSKSVLVESPSTWRDGFSNSRKLNPLTFSFSQGNRHQTSTFVYQSKFPDAL
jgi:hypothetical protein